jgi:hypothetical protein
MSKQEVQDKYFLMNFPGRNAANCIRQHPPPVLMR